MILSGVSSVEMSNEGQRTAADSVCQKWLPSEGAYLIIGELLSGSRPTYAVQCPMYIPCFISLSQMTLTDIQGQNEFHDLSQIFCIP